MRKLILVALALILNLEAKEIYATFDVKATKSANLAFDNSGIVKEVLVDIGSVVKKGQKLSSLENEDVKARLSVNQVALKYKLADYKRQKKIRNIIDKEKFGNYEYAYKNANAEVIYQKAVLDKTYLNAPFDGIIISKDVEVGDMVSQQSSKTLFQIESLSNVKLVLKFDSKYWNDVKVGQIFKYQLDGDSKKYEEKISKVYPSIDSDSRTLSAEVLTKNIPTGLFGTGFIITE
ncbi:efflux RND transporter periplasmic adaptor subunit [Arcobacter sp. LA11]|uniref:efflux RND transporter periplasmic adaptor subunit n=1 Tax=Arcobacter sp. LA11 TaxID=1898176 RepID=UPI000932A887|nr:efflux RND transporter periplasmic adaptor subunit [Arcobacter sp. LA11]